MGEPRNRLTRYTVVRYGRPARDDGSDQSREEVATFDDPMQAEEYLDWIMGRPEKRQNGGAVFYKLEESDDTPTLVQAKAFPVGPPADYQQAVFQPVLPKITAKITIKDAKEQAIRKTGGRAKLAQIRDR